MAVVALPPDIVDQHIVQPGAFDWFSLTGGGVGDPELDLVLDVECEGDLRAVV